VIVIGGVVATGHFLRRVIDRTSFGVAYRLYRRGLGRALLLGLEFLVAGDIIRTVTESPTLTEVAVLAGIVLIRTFLSVALEVETEGRWPWQSERRADDDDGTVARD
jgi:uncharacterized membrane protein